MSDLTFEQHLVDALHCLELQQSNFQQNCTLYESEIKDVLQELLNNQKIDQQDYLQLLDLLATIVFNINSQLQEIQLTGPTGETNRLIYQAKGLCWIDYQQAADFKSVFALLSISLLTGNICLIIQRGDLVTNFCLLLKAKLTAGLVTLIDNKYTQLLIDHPAVNLVASLAAKKHIQQLNQQLAQKPGAITSLVSLPINEPIHNISCSDLLLRFINERCITNNITAVGGNTQLLFMHEE